MINEQKLMTDEKLIIYWRSWNETGSNDNINWKFCM